MKEATQTGGKHQTGGEDGCLCHGFQKYQIMLLQVKTLHPNPKTETIMNPKVCRSKTRSVKAEKVKRLPSVSAVRTLPQELVRADVILIVGSEKRKL